MRKVNVPNLIGFRTRIDDFAFRADNYYATKHIEHTALHTNINTSDGENFSGQNLIKWPNIRFWAGRCRNSLLSGL